MSKINRFKAALAKMLAAFGNVSTDKGIIAWDGEEDLKAGDNVYIEDADGNREVAQDGEYVTSDAKTIVVEGGKVSEIRDPEAEVSPEEPVERVEDEKEVRMIQTDKGKLEWNNEDEDLKAGDEVFVRDEEGNRVPAPDGEYRTEDGKVIVVVEGKVSEIRDPEAEVAPERDEEMESLRAENAELRSQLEVLTRKMEEMARIPVAEPAHEEVKTQESITKTGIKGFDRLAYLASLKK